MNSITCTFCGGRGRVPCNPYDREGRYRGPTQRVCEYCGGCGYLKDEPAARNLLPATQYPDDGGAGQPPPGTPNWA